MIAALLRETRARPLVAIGMASLTLCSSFFLAVLFALADAGLRTPFPVPNPDRVFVVSVINPETRESTYNVPGDALDLRGLGERGLVVGRYALTSAELGVGEAVRPVFAAVVSPAMADIVGLPSPGGRHAGVIASGRLWYRSFGQQSPDGDHLVLNGVSRSITGYHSGHIPLPGASGVPFVVIDPALELSPEALRTFVRLPEGLPMADGEALLRQHLADGLALRLSGIAQLANASMPALSSLAWLGSCLMALTMISILHVTAAGIARQRGDWHTRFLLGATRTSIVSRTSLLIGTHAAVGAIVGVIAATAFLAMSGPQWAQGLNLPRWPTLSLDVSVCLLIGTFVAAVTIAGAISLAFASRIHAGGRTVVDPSQGRRLSQAVLGVQATCGVALLSLAILFGYTFYSVTTTSRGLRTGDVLQVSIKLYQTVNGWPTGVPTPAAARSVFRQMELELGAVPGVGAIAQADLVPFAHEPSLESSVLEQAMDEEISVRRVSSGYFAALGISRVSGHLFTPKDDQAEGPAVAIVSAGVSSRFPEVGIGSTVHVDGRALEVIGIVDDVRDELYEPSRPTVYVPHTNASYRRYSGTRSFLIRGVVHCEALRSAVQAIAARHAVQQGASRASTLDDLLLPSFRAPVIHAWSGLVIGLLSLVILTVTTAAITSQVARARAHEIAVRVACGASRGHVHRLMLRTIVSPTVVGATGGMLLGHALGRAVAPVGDAGSRLLGGPWVAAAFVIVVLSTLLVLSATRRQSTPDLRLLR